MSSTKSRLVTWTQCLALSTAIVLTPVAATLAQTSSDINLPSLGTVAGADLSLYDERQLGEEMMRHLCSTPSYLSDEEIATYLESLGHRLVAAGGPQPYMFEFFPMRDKTLNAFAMPGGFIAVHTGLIVAAANESELAGVVGHEIGHVTQRHIARMIERSQGSTAMTIGSILLAILAARAGGSSGGNAAMAITMGTQAAMLQKQLAYSRDAEREADRVGLQSLSNAGFDPKGMEHFFAKMQKKTGQYESASMAYLSTHPLTSERMGDMQNRTRLLPAVHPTDGLTFRLIQARARVLQETQYDGFLQVAEHFRNKLTTASGSDRTPHLYGLSVAYEKMNKPSQALNYANEAKATSTERSILLEKQIAALMFQLAKTPKEKEKAIRIARESFERYPDSAMLSRNLTRMLIDAKKPQETIQFLRKQRALANDNPDYHAYLAKCHEAMGHRSLWHSETGEMYLLLGNEKAALYQFDLAQKAADADFYSMSIIDARLRELRTRLNPNDPSKKRP